MDPCSHELHAAFIRTGNLFLIFYCPILVSLLNCRLRFLFLANRVDPPSLIFCCFRDAFARYLEMITTKVAFEWNVFTLTKVTTGGESCILFS